LFWTCPMRPLDWSFKCVNDLVDDDDGDGGGDDDDDDGLWLSIAWRYFTVPRRRRVKKAKATVTAESGSEEWRVELNPTYQVVRVVLDSW